MRGATCGDLRYLLTLALNATSMLRVCIRPHLYEVFHQVFRSLFLISSLNIIFKEHMSSYKLLSTTQIGRRWTAKQS